MEGVSLALSAVQTLLAALQCPDIEEISSIIDYVSHLDELQNTVSTVKAVLLDAETKQEISHQAQNYIHKLRDAVYDADDLLDEFVTYAEQKQLVQNGKTSEKVCFFFSHFNPLVVASKMPKQVKEIQKKLEGIANDHNKFGLGVANDHNKFGFQLDSLPIRKRREDTCSYVYEGNIIGRGDDVEKIVSILLDSNAQHQYQRDISFLSIVGIGGLGKTALAQLLFNDKRVTRAFPQRLWTCVSDHDQEKLDIYGILYKILTSATRAKHEELPKEEVQRQLREQLASNKYLLVLDDVWTENRSHWLNLVEYLLKGQRGSWIVVTTRSEETARIIGSDSVHKLQGLSKADSWNLFKKLAFGSEQINPDHDLVPIGEQIAQGCAGVPLALRVVGSLLYGQVKNQWLSIQERGLANIRESQNDIMPILMISYHNLESPLKSCFSYCALFPKDFEIEKKVLLDLWKAQGYVIPLDGGQNMEDAAEEYFSILLRRCFFQDVKIHPRTGKIKSCKIHDLMHDLAQKLAAKEIFVSDSLSDHIDEKVRHLAHIGDDAPKYSLNKTRLRSYVQLTRCSYYRDEMDQHYIKEFVEMLTSARVARVLYLRCCNVHYLPQSIGNLLHLRYLNLSRTSLVELPESFSKLYNLETLILDVCTELKKFPKDMKKLVKLRVLSARSCTSVTNLSSDLGKLTKLRVLDMRECKLLTSIPSYLGNLGELRVLRFDGCDGLTKMPSGLNKLTNLEILPLFVTAEASLSCKEWVDHLEELKVLDNLKGSLFFKIECPKNSKIDWRGGGYLKNKKHIHSLEFKFVTDNVDGATANTEEALMEMMEPHCDLKEIKVWLYNGVRMPSWLSSLSNVIKMELVHCAVQEVKWLGNLHNLKELELVGLPNLEYIIEKHTGTTEEDSSLFPSLVRLEVNKMPKLKGWGIQTSDDDNLQSFCVTQLESLVVYYCPELTNFPHCPRVKSLDLKKINDRLNMRMERQMDDEKGDTMSLKIPEIREVIIETDNMTWLKSLTMESLQQVTSVRIHRDDRAVESWEAIENGMPWPSLRNLELSDFWEMETLPNWIRFLSASLETLRIKECWKFEALPAWLTELTSLKELHVYSLNLKKKCEKPTGEYWPYIQHIPRIQIYGSLFR